MGPVLEQSAVLFDERLQILPPIGLVARKQDLVMRPLDPLDAVDLDKAEIMDQLQQPGLGQRQMRRPGKPCRSMKMRRASVLERRIAMRGR